MDRIKELLEEWKDNGLTNPDSLEKLYEAISLLIEEIQKP